MNSNIQKLLTADGSHTLFSPEFNEIYHSRNGAVQESNHVFIQHGLAQIKSDAVRVFELGFGTGLNAFLAFIYAEKNGKQIYYEGVELYPVEIELAKSLNYADVIDCFGNSSNYLPREGDSEGGNQKLNFRSSLSEAGKFKSEFLQLHTASWNETHQLGNNFSFRKNHISILDYQPVANDFDVIFFDAFAPDIQSDLWSENMFQKMYAMLKVGGRLSTYCAKGNVRRAMQAADFKVERHPGPPGKREMLVAVK